MNAPQGCLGLPGTWQRWCTRWQSREHMLCTMMPLLSFKPLVSTKVAHASSSVAQGAPSSGDTHVACFPKEHKSRHTTSHGLHAEAVHGAHTCNT